MDAARWKVAKRLLQEALDRTPDGRSSFLDAACAGDAALHAEVAAFLAAHAAAGDRFESPPLVETASVAAPPERLGPYRVLRELGRGGMGTVYLAEREGADFHQQVAIKLIHRGMDSEAILRRFRNERRILASLNHANIARLFDGGTTEDGLPYFVMEHVDGLPLDRWWANHEASGSPIAERLRLVRQVCAAVHYAHQNLIVHRDLKPGNILVTADGTPKLLDFGIAKLLDPENPAAEDLTAFARPMTREYASPEQVRGEPITTASDIYSLGVLLDHLLTGRPPHRRLASDLEAIVLQAMRKDPARRYASADQLSEDLRRYLAGLPVLARRDSLGYRARKLIQRHRFGAAAAALAGVALIATTAIAVQQERVAERQRVRAERRFADVRRLASSFLFEFHDAIRDLPGSTRARELVVRKALEYLDGLAAEAGGDRGLLAELAEAYQRVGDVQGMPYRASLGHTGDALQSYEKALALRERLLHEQPGNPEYRLARAVVESRIGSVLAARGDTRRALERHRSALAEISALSQGTQAEPGERYAPAQAEMAAAAVAVGDDRWELGDLGSAIAEYRGALRAAQQRRRDRPADREARRYVGVVEQRLGDALGLETRWPEALGHQQASLAVDRGLATDDPTSAETQRDLATDYTRLAVAHQALGDLKATLAEHRLALEIRERLRAADPKDSRALTDLAESLVELADVQAQSGDYPSALASLRRALPLRREQAATDPTNLRWRDDLASALTNLGTTLAASGDPAAALAALQEALAVRESIAATMPELSASNPALANLYLTLGQLLAHASGPHAGEACGWLVKARRAFAQMQDRARLTGDAVDRAAAADRDAARCAG
jgi:tetratricopeptide (TPR) repeat protein/tRNA A-37 threonylcarbamoyl transferase component Bud32